MSKEIGPRERQLREMREQKHSRPPPTALRDKVAAIKPKSKPAKKAKKGVRS